MKIFKYISVVGLAYMLSISIFFHHFDAASLIYVCALIAIIFGD